MVVIHYTNRTNTVFCSPTFSIYFLEVSLSVIYINNFLVCFCHCRMVCLSLAANVLALGAVADFGALHCQPSRNFDKSTKLDLTTEPPLLGRCCYAQGFFYFLSLLRFS